MTCPVCGWAIPMRYFARLLRFVRGDETVCCYCWDTFAWSKPGLRRICQVVTGEPKPVRSSSLVLQRGGDVA